MGLQLVTLRKLTMGDEGFHSFEGEPCEINPASVSRISRLYDRVSEIYFLDGKKWFVAGSVEAVRRQLSEPAKVPMDPAGAVYPADTIGF